MHIRFNSIAFLVLTFASGFSAHAADEGALQYPRREIDRPYIILPHQQELRFGGSVHFPSSGSGSSGKLGFEPILQYESGHSETFAWLFNPLPFGFKYQFLFNDHHRLGLKAYYEYFAYGVSLNYRFRFLQQAIELEATYDHMNIFYIKTRTREIVLRPTFQITDHVAMGVSGTYGRYSFGSDYLDNLFHAFIPDSSNPEWTSATGLSAGLDVQVSVSPQLDIKAGMTANHYFSGGQTVDGLTASLMTKIRM